MARETDEQASEGRQVNLTRSSRQSDARYPRHLASAGKHGQRVRKTFRVWKTLKV